MTKTLVFVENPEDLKYLKTELISPNLIFSFNIFSHKALDNEKITHKIAEEYLSEEDKTTIFDLTIKCYSWFEQHNLFKNMEFNGISLLGILDTAEFHRLVISELQRFLTVKRILESEKPDRIIVSHKLGRAVQAIDNKKTVDLKLFSSDTENTLAWDKIEIKFNIGRLPISFYVSRRTYVVFKNIFEGILCKILNLHFHPNKKKTILLLEFNPSAYSELLTNLGKSDKNIVLFNLRRSAAWNISSINTLLKSKIKMLDINKILERDDKQQISSLKDIFIKNLEQIWSSDDLFHNLFSIENSSFWPCIKSKLFETFYNRMSEYMKLVIISKRIFEKIDLSYIISLNMMGETEKTITALNKKNVPFVLLEHAYANYTPEIARFDVLSSYHMIKNKIAVWGEVQKKYLLEQKRATQDQIIITGSPRHDSFFAMSYRRRLSQNKIILLAIHPITDLVGQSNTTVYIKLEEFLRNFYHIIKEFSNVKVIVKLHPSQNIYNQNIIKLINQLDDDASIYHIKPIKELLANCDVLVNISPEGFDPSTVIMEALILNKPVMNIVLDNKFYEFQFVKDNAVLNALTDSNLKKNLNDILFNEILRQDLTINGKKHLENYLSNHGNASVYLARMLDSI